MLINLDDVNLVTLWGAQNENFELIKRSFPKLRLVARGNDLKVLGEEVEQQRFKAAFQGIVEHIERFQSLDAVQLEELVGAPIRTERTEEKKTEPAACKGEPIVYGPDGFMMRENTHTQGRSVETISNDDMIFANETEGK